MMTWTCLMWGYVGSASASEEAVVVEAVAAMAVPRRATVMREGRTRMREGKEE